MTPFPKSWRAQGYFQSGDDRARALYWRADVCGKPSAITTSMPAWVRRSRPDRVRAPSKDVAKHRRSMPRILSAIAGCLVAKTHSGSLRGEGSLPKQKLTARRRGDRVDGGMSAFGTSRHFAAAQQFGRIGSEADIKHRAGFMSTRPNRKVVRIGHCDRNRE